MSVCLHKSEDPDQMLRPVASELALHCLPLLYGMLCINRLNFDVCSHLMRCKHQCLLYTLTISSEAFRCTFNYIAAVKYITTCSLMPPACGLRIIL